MLQTCAPEYTAQARGRLEVVRWRSFTMFIVESLPHITSLGHKLLCSMAVAIAVLEAPATMAVVPLAALCQCGERHLFCGCGQSLPVRHRHKSSTIVHNREIAKHTQRKNDRYTRPMCLFSLINAITSWVAKASL
jgi:hypothetical protein